MADSLYEKNYNPDVLSCLANLSNDEVFTPPNVANQMLDMLPQELFSDPNTKFLDPACKSGVFLREIAKRLIKGLANKIPDLQTRLDHIFHEQLYGIAITELTALLSRRSLYCSKYPHSKYSVSKFSDEQGNIRFRRVEHTWRNGRCVYCGASESEYGGRDGLETHAYEFIHTMNAEDIWNMKFDVIISNPPYQMNDGGNGSSARPIYNNFVSNAKKLNSKFLTMIIPSRWFAGGKGLDDFRDEMINDVHIKILHDYLNSVECFSGVEIKGGICYFLRDKDYCGKCKIYTHQEGIISSVAERPLKEEGSDVFIRFNEAVDILHKVKDFNEASFADIVSSRQPFGITTTFRGLHNSFPSCIKVYERGGICFTGRDKILRNSQYIDDYKVLISKAYNAGDGYPHQVINKPFISEPGSCCTETYIMIGPFDNETFCNNVISYIQTKFFRFLVLLKKSSQNAAKGVYQFVPMQDFSKPWTDAELYAKYNLTQEEIDFIESMIKPMNTDGERDE